MKKRKLVVIIGPTAVGKTKLSIDLAHRLNGEIISGDSMQIYKGMDIGTAKITEAEMEGIKHHLLDIKNPDEDFSVAEFQHRVRPLIDEISNQSKTPMIVGGTGLYIQSVLYNYQFTENPSDPEFRSNMELVLKEKGEHAIHEMLEKIDPESASKIHPNNSRRVIRALEVFHCTNKPMSEYISSQEQELLYDVALVGLTMDRDILYERINKRVDIMVAQGLFEEVKWLYDKGIRNTQSIQAIGYKEIYDYFDGKITFDDAINQLKQNSRRYAKRQLTWFRNKMDVNWFDMTPPINYNNMVDEIFTYIAGKL
ncbi:tRNA (adenosine(37)-N6)-dimethylallyltransferase MiaA [Metabacillus sediminilitoris]|uniref:tRNA dimethylallyltransferase n=1 Tax=Metabacillus sediminilitoris TaxID=2567941 RepID=A0A4S4BW03_9BACI|nr:tRNA (adenosine(37)-N6)-dimethylallyltransferase MiaA [Metabacillus sediminilitoris]THF79353.1 tRNA (adenosine(37)-N6)-dimethylallyltransferase MiaA [Metabacillus sediminilitoris]